MDAADLIKRLKLQPHPEGGWYRETWRSDAALPDGRAAATSILFLLEQGQRSRWHRVDAEEIWIFQAGSPLKLRTAQGPEVTETRLGPGPGQSPQHVVHKDEWQAAEADRGWTLVACIVSPGFRFEGFELAPPGWEP
ncbi:MAG: cupin domain-containing protein [Phenylobacterium sp.]|uniref:cupin domain-containing protein n=1 Tax=Phenylobacterium sp. TaxID=1871053 RepID=UPI0011FD0A76|nr:cupin domain-containing protein [Phenylobacterium sp.]TAL38239.1 MAG: cupin domain-containing protein [Phenylobacterium sp.]